jgi:hypothetical protein
MIVMADTSPINYLIFSHCAEYLGPPDRGPTVNNRRKLAWTRFVGPRFLRRSRQKATDLKSRSALPCSFRRAELTAEKIAGEVTQSTPPFGRGL